jgi:hypothetical protein
VVLLSQFVVCFFYVGLVGVAGHAEDLWVSRECTVEVALLGLAKATVQEPTQRAEIERQSEHAGCRN